MSNYLIRQASEFQHGYTLITDIDETTHDTGIRFGILKLKKNEKYKINSELESAFLLMNGECVFQYDAIEKKVNRLCYFNQNPYALHLAANQLAYLVALSDCEFAVTQVKNINSFSTTFYDSTNMLQSEHRGKDLLNNTAYRMVRTIFDKRNSPQSNLVLGEVITAPGRWSSYPPHHHTQPEIYHYRFTEPQGYGHAECGDEVFKVRQYDTYKIIDMNDHAQAAAPGYGMYYLWVIRHLDEQPYHQPEFTKEHHWTALPEANERVWKGEF